MPFETHTVGKRLKILVDSRTKNSLDAFKDVNNSESLSKVLKRMKSKFPICLMDYSKMAIIHKRFQNDGSVRNFFYVYDALSP